MFSYIKGALVEINGDHIVIEAGGVGYLLYYPLNAMSVLPSLNENFKVYVHYAAREDGVSLYAFPGKSEREMFELLISVSGIGPKGAMNILGSAQIETLFSCIARGETAGLVAMPGIGKKTAERIVLELREKIRKLAGQVPAIDFSDNGAGSYEEALQALQALGFNVNRARQALAALPESSAGFSAEELIRQALTLLDEQRR
jgi:Holliday junction DNA helicase RuvA